MTASRGRRCARSALMRPTTHRVKVEETSDIGSPREPTDENDLILSFYNYIGLGIPTVTTQDCLQRVM